MKTVYIFFFLLPLFCFSQDEKEYVFGTFRSGQLINVQTTEMVQPKSFEFSIRHRFGMIGLNSTTLKQFLGLDLPANIRFAFTFPVTKNLNIGIGRTKNEKTFDGEIKLLFLRQTEDNNTPVSVAGYFNIAVKTGDFQKIAEYSFFGDGSLTFRNKFNHRLSYCSEIIMARKFSEKISLQVTPAYFYKNLVTPGNENETFAVPVGCVFKTGLHSSFAFEYAYCFNNRPDEKNYPLSIAWEVGTAGHIFQLIATSTGELVEQEIYTHTGYNYLKGNFALGFNIRRTFWQKKFKK